MRMLPSMTGCYHWARTSSEPSSMVYQNRLWANSLTQRSSPPLATTQDEFSAFDLWCRRSVLTDTDPTPPDGCTHRAPLPVDVSPSVVSIS
ncbi:hypothetical protein N7466_001626 [Penicillium verhagenii]|uniref:uncharacterized protein n=1 Tax=Penicillium verhagenii TaxID=1562060 RepID=UPI0025455350|nr:uncharacterized protein N7466_001626 [Penicillium verhagenii]KAJ5938492.1 hypothetical protein N7466_001626 [Penicillium verhagenii]